MQINSYDIQYNLPELVSLLVLHVVWLWLDTFFAQFFTGMSKLSQILSIVFNVDLYELHKPALLNVLYTWKQKKHIKSMVMQENRYCSESTNYGTGLVVLKNVLT